MLSQAPPTFHLPGVAVFQRVDLRSFAEELNAVIKEDHNQEEESVASQVDVEELPARFELADDQNHELHDDHYDQ